MDDEKNEKTVWELRDERLKQERKFYRRYIDILKSHLKENITDEEKTELKGLHADWKDLVKHVKIKKVDDKKKVLELQKLYDEAGKQLTKMNQPPKELCECCWEVKDHDILDCPMNCCKTPDGMCLR